MTQIVVPFRGESGKQRLDAPEEERVQLALAMLGDVLAAATVTGRTFVVTGDATGRALAGELGAEPRAAGGIASWEPASFASSFRASCASFARRAPMPVRLLGARTGSRNSCCSRTRATWT